MRRLLRLLSSSWRNVARLSGSSSRFRMMRFIPGACGSLLFGALSLNYNGSYSALDFHQRLISCPRVAAAEKPRSHSQVNFIADVVEKVLPAVVYIETGHRFGFRSSSGSGFIFREDGHILTNFHVVGSNSAVKVRLSDDRVLTGQVIAANPNLDLALVKVPAKDLPFIELGRSSSLRTGEWVIALGAPRFLTNSVTVGVVSAIDRDLGIHRGQRYIQTDAAITHGNSGGPLVNVDGQVVGINTLKLEAGIGFAITSDDVQRFVDSSVSSSQRNDSSLVDSSRSSRRFSDASGSSGKRQAYLGLNMMTLQYHILEDLRRMIPGYFDGVSKGVMVHSVNPDSPASQAGLAQFDVIISMNGIPITSAKEVYNVVDNLPINANCTSPVQIEILRRGRLLQIIVKPEVVEVYR